MDMSGKTVAAENEVCYDLRVQEFKSSRVQEFKSCDLSVYDFLSQIKFIKSLAQLGSWQVPFILFKTTWTNMWIPLWTDMWTDLLEGSISVFLTRLLFQLKLASTLVLITGVR